MASPVHRSNPQTPCSSSSTRQPKQKEVENETQASSSSTTSNKNRVGKGVVGRRAKRALKREAADKGAAAKHQQHLIRFGRQ
ncbi:Solute carrier family 35 member F4 [Bienertia sinuspersici]